MSGEREITRGPGGKLFSRSAFLNGDQEVFYGPHQPPDAWEGLGFPRFDDPGFDPDAALSEDDGHDYFVPNDRDYTPPDDWPAVGVLIRPLQVVHVSTYWSNYINTWTGPPDMSGPWMGIDLGEMENDEKVRLEAIFDEVKTTIEALRPGRTWVNHIKWLRTFIFTGNPSLPETIWWDFRRAGQYIPVFSVDTSDTYLGVDFLSIYVGRYAIDFVGEFGSGPEESIVRGDWSFNSLDESEPDSVASFEADIAFDRASPEYSATEDRIQSMVDRFVGVRYMLWYSDVYDGLDLNEGAGGSGLLYNDKLSEVMFGAFAEDFPNVEVVGAASELTSAEEVIDIIADHFGFDPDTGQDV